MSGPTQVPTHFLPLFVYGAFTLSHPTFQMVQLKFQKLYCRPYNPEKYLLGLGSFPFARRYLENHNCFYFPPLTEMSHFSGFRFLILCIRIKMIGYYPYRVSPFGYLRIIASYRLPEAFRRFVRPSSPFDAKTSSDSSYKLNLYFFAVSNASSVQ